MSDEQSKAELTSNLTPDANSGKQRRKIPGNLPYTTAPGSLERTLEKIPIVERPSVFSPDFLSTVIGVSGGSSRPVPPILKSCGFLSSSGMPTELYDQFRTDGSRASAALTGLKKGYGEIFKRNQFAHKLDEKGLVDLINSITGLRQGDPISRQILNTFKVFQKYTYLLSEENSNSPIDQAADQDYSEPSPLRGRSKSLELKEIGLVYNINIALPETTNIDVYNAIFRSLRENMLQ